ncbi:YbaB/EbfC family nucleoid-associated protein [Trebonia sp.]|uniref:YbaB/EbfC family nucleoid-associated protein n=1 Tax=Trebonia sp. TaxID=2767075 RepID=UPI00345B52FF
MEPGGFDMQQIFQAAQQMQAQLMNAQQALADSEVTGSAGGGAVRAVVSGAGELLDLTIEPSVIDPADPAETAGTVADLVLAAIRDANRAAADLQQRQLGALSGAVPGLDLTGLGLPGVGLPGAATGLPGDDDYDDDDDDEDDDDLDDEDDDDDDEYDDDEDDDQER